MTEHGIRPDVVTYTGLIDGLCKDGRATQAMGLLDLMLKKGVEPNTVTCNVIINGLCKEGRVGDAFKILEMMTKKGKKPDVVTYNTLLVGFCADGQIDEAMKLLKLMLKDENFVEPDVTIFNSLIQRLRKASLMRLWSFAKGLFSKMKACGLSPMVIDYNTLMASLCKEGSLGQARGLFQELRNATHGPDVVSFTTIIDGMLGMGLAPDYMTFSSLISRLSKLGQLDEAKNVFEKIMASGFTPDTFVYDSLLKGFASMGKTKEIIDFDKWQIKVLFLTQIISTILTCLCDMSEDLDVMEILPNFSLEASKEASISCDKLLSKLNESHPELNARASLPGFQVLPLQQFGIWGPEITTKLDPQKDTYGM
ncbi:pentatricopeptide repeat-containing protein [Quercus suber]|uniref:Pentatricopeptide repeat-containing protein n=1 Tax=Quercus suber TaxID=58331 RepID=A0AAW0LAR3_QUESU